MSTPAISQKSICLEYNTPNPSYFSTVQSSLLMPYKVVMSICTLRNIRQYPEFSITEQMPNFQIWCEWAANKCGLNPCYPHISELHLPAMSTKKLKLPFTEKELTLKLPIFNTSHLIKEEFLNKAILRPHRRLNFNGSTS